MMTKLLSILCMCALLGVMGCASPNSYKGKMTDTGLEITTEPAKLFGIWEVKGVPAGKYHYKEGDRELDVDTKTELKLLEVNASKLGGK